jgi:hypothetical protein
MHIFYAFRDQSRLGMDERWYIMMQCIERKRRERGRVAAVANYKPCVFTEEQNT